MRDRPTRVWILKDGSKLTAATIKPGLNDNRYVEVIGGDIKEGDEVVLGVVGQESGAGMNQQTNPFQPRMTGGGPRGRGF